jgi:hypothetical protein
MLPGVRQGAQASLKAKKAAQNLRGQLQAHRDMEG